jgi:archaetidylinositol phosphate synthase
MTQISMPRRSNEGLLQPLERPALLWMVQRIPNWVTPNFLTGVAFIGTCIAAAAYVLSRWQPAFLWLATAGLLVNWFGDSLDGTLARFRQIERPRYGFFLDQNLDAFEQLLIAIGIGFSGFIRFELAMLTLAAYFLMSILSLVRAVVSNVFGMTYFGIGLTELRAAFLIMNALMFFFPPKPIAVFGLTMVYPEILSVAWTVAIVVSFLTIFRAYLRNPAIEETPPSNN